MTRICITGGPRTGKTTLATQLWCENQHEADMIDSATEADHVRHTDDLINLGWSEASERVAKCWLTQPGPWIIEGVAVCRALRKWREAHPGERPPVDKVIRLTEPHEALSKGQASMAKGEETVWREIEGWLFDAGVEVEHRGHDPGSDRHRVPHPTGPAGASRRFGWMGVEPGDEP